MYKPFYSKQFQKQIKAFPQKEQIKILKKVKNSLADPRQAGTKLITTKPPVYKFRAGEYRIFFELDNQTKTIIITSVVRRTTQTYQ